MPAVHGDRRFKEHPCQTHMSHGVRGSRDCLTGVETEAHRCTHVLCATRFSIYSEDLCLPHIHAFFSLPAAGLIPREIHTVPW